MERKFLKQFPTENNSESQHSLHRRQQVCRINILWHCSFKNQTCSSPFRSQAVSGFFKTCLPQVLVTLSNTRWQTLPISFSYSELINPAHRAVKLYFHQANIDCFLLGCCLKIFSLSLGSKACTYSCSTNADKWPKERKCGKPVLSAWIPPLPLDKPENHQLILKDTKKGSSLLPGARGAGGVKLLAPRVLSPPTCEVFKNKIQPSTSEDLIGFTEGLNNIPCSEERERKAYKMEGFYKLVRRGKKY